MPDAQCVLRKGDGVLLLGPPDALDEPVSRIGSEEPGRLMRDRRDYDVTRVYVSRPGFIGRTLGAIARPNCPITISHLRGRDTELVATRDLVLEWGDRLVVIAPTGQAAALRQFFGDSIRGNAELSLVSIGVGTEGPTTPVSPAWAYRVHADARGLAVFADKQRRPFHLRRGNFYIAILYSIDEGQESCIPHTD